MPFLPSPFSVYQMARRGFTLSELLVSVAVLGLIAAFTIPKVITSVEDTRKKAVFKHSYSVITDAMGKLALENIDGNIGAAAMFAKLQQYIPAVKYCPNNGITEGCRTTVLDIGWETRPAMVLSTGAILHISIYDPSVQWPSNIEIEIDYNGDAGLNLAGTGNLNSMDTVALLANYGDVPMTHPTQLKDGNPYVIRPGTVVPWNPQTNGVYGFYELFSR